MMIKLSYTNKLYRAKEFLRLMQKRMRKICKELGIHPGKPIVIEGNLRNFKIARELLTAIFKQPEVNNGSSEIKAYSIQEEGTRAFNYLQEHNELPKVKNILSAYSEEDIMHLCEIYNIAYVKPEVHPLISAMLIKHPDTVFSLSNSLKELAKK